MFRGIEEGGAEAWRPESFVVLGGADLTRGETLRELKAEIEVEIEEDEYQDDATREQGLGGSLEAGSLPDRATAWKKPT